MHPKPSLNYLAGYPIALTAQVQQSIAQGHFGALLKTKYPLPHEVRTDKSLYDFVSLIKQQYLNNTQPLSRVEFDSKLHILKNALGTHTTISRVQGGNLKAKREIRIATLFKEVPIDFLRMIVVHELAHQKERAHNKSFYQLCRHMEPEYAQLEFEMRAYLTYLEAGGIPLWPASHAISPPAI
ncbi:MAG: M48 family metallopeptidase [Sideroxydans sp.]|nr:M48 family metallopeptidase [Sideroxydans sp.]